MHENQIRHLALLWWSPLIVTACLLASCAPSVSYVDQPKPIPLLPADVTKEVQRDPTQLPPKVTKPSALQKLVSQLRQSELAYHRALMATYERYEAIRDKLRATQ